MDLGAPNLIGTQKAVWIHTSRLYSVQNAQVVVDVAPAAATARGLVRKYVRNISANKKIWATLQLCREHGA